LTFLFNKLNEMKNLIFLCIGCWCIVTACQKSISSFGEDNGTPGADSTIAPGDTITYEVITSDTTGWFGMWNEPGGNLASNKLDRITYGSPEYLSSGWKYSFVCPPQPFQPFISVAARTYAEDITVNIYKNGRLINSSTNDAMKGVAKLLVNSNADALQGTTTDPVLTYEVIISEPDTAKFESDGWVGQWNNPDGVINSLNNPLLTIFAIPSGWRYSFKPDHLPFTMSLHASPYTMMEQK
jgi:hypothetical protein